MRSAAERASFGTDTFGSQDYSYKGDGGNAMFMATSATPMGQYTTTCTTNS